MGRIVFGDLPEEHSRAADARIVLIPVPYDETSTWMKGADRGPEAIIEASAHLELYDLETDSEVYRLGIATDAPVTEKSSPEAMTAAVRDRVAFWLEAGKLPVVVGGEHSVAVGAVRACAERYPDLSVLQLDAHADLRGEYLGSSHNHACVMARVREICPVVQAGIRSLDASEKELIEKGRFFPAAAICRSRDDAWQEAVLAPLSRRVYLTIDLDVFDPGIMPSTGTPEPGGLSWDQVTGLLRRLCACRELVGFDVVELCPGGNKAPDFLAAKLIYTLLSSRFAAASRSGRR